MAYCTAANVKTYLGISGSGDDTLIGEIITYAQQAIDSHCRRTFEAGSDTDQYFTVGRDTEGLWLWFDRDIAAITTVLNGDPSSTEVTSAQYVTEPYNAPYHGIKILGSAAKVWEYNQDPENAIKVTGKWAYSAAAPADITFAAIRLSGYMYRAKDSSMDIDRPIITDAGVTLLPLGLPNDVIKILAPYRKAL